MKITLFIFLLFSFLFYKQNEKLDCQKIIEYYASVNSYDIEFVVNKAIINNNDTTVYLINDGNAIRWNNFYYLNTKARLIVINDKYGLAFLKNLSVAFFAKRGLRTIDQIDPTVDLIGYMNFIRKNMINNSVHKTISANNILYKIPLKNNDLNINQFILEVDKTNKSLKSMEIEFKPYKSSLDKNFNIKVDKFIYNKFLINQSVNKEVFDMENYILKVKDSVIGIGILKGIQIIKSDKNHSNVK